MSHHEKTLESKVINLKCEFDYCIYNKNWICILDAIQINSSGMCEDCEIVSVPEENLEKYKNTRLKEIERIWNEIDHL